MAGPETATHRAREVAGPLARLFEDPGAPRWDLPEALANLYGGGLGFTDGCVYANFVSSIDGVVALGPEYRSSGSTISGREPADRFVMGLLRACASAVLIGAGTLRATPTHRWTPAHVYPDAATEFAELRSARGLAAEPELVVVTAGGHLPADHPALTAGAVIATTTAGATRLAGRLPPACTILALGAGPSLPPAALLAAARERGHTTVLSEAGPRLTGQLIEEQLLDELFVTVSPVLAGRADTPRSGLVAGVELLPQRRETGTLASARRAGSYLFLRYRLRGGEV